LKSEDKERRVEFGRMASAEDHGECETCSDDADSRSEHQLAVMYFTLGGSLDSLEEGQLNDLSELLEDVRRSTATEEQSQRQKPQVRTKKTTSKGDAQIKIIGALSSHHQFDGDECLNLEPIGNNELARLGEVSQSSASLFFQKQFASGDSTSGEGLRKYRGACRSSYTLSLEIKRIRDELIPTELWNSLPVDHEDDAGETATDE